MTMNRGPLNTKPLNMWKYHVRMTGEMVITFKTKTTGQQRTKAVKNIGVKSDSKQAIKMG